MKNTYIKSPLNYVGGKYKLLPQIIPLFPNNIDTFVDLFGGGFNVGINVNADYIVYNDVEPHVVELLRGLYRNDYDDVHSMICQIIDEYGLSRSDVHGYEFYGCESNSGLGQYNKDKYYKLRADYNQNPTWIKFYTLITCAFSNQIRFNSKGEFNMPYGKRDYNKSLQSKLQIFMDAMHQKNIAFSNSDFRDLKFYPNGSENERMLVYCDPPYFNSVATYNENNGWSEKDEQDLLNLLDELNTYGIRFALSNNLKYQNPILAEWRKQYHTHYLNGDYSNCNYHKKDRSSDTEVLITNYDIKL